MVQSIKHHGGSVGASRVTTGNHPLYLELESRLASFFGFQSATLVSSGYASSLIAVQALTTPPARVVMDEKSHSSLRLAAGFLEVPSYSFAHRDTEDFHRRLRERGEGSATLVLTDGLFSFSGAVPDLTQYAKGLGAGDVLLVDDAHGAGVIGPRGRGVLDSKPRLSPNQLILTLTLSKAFGVHGGVILSSRAFQANIHQKSHFFAGHTPPPLHTAAGTLAAIDIFESEGEILRGRLAETVNRLRMALRHGGLDVPPHPGPVVGLIPKSRAASRRLRQSLLDASIYPPLVVYPGAPLGGYYRFAFSSEHGPAQLDLLARVLLRHKSCLGPMP